MVMQGRRNIAIVLPGRSISTSIMGVCGGNRDPRISILTVGVWSRLIWKWNGRFLRKPRTTLFISPIRYLRVCRRFSGPHAEPGFGIWWRKWTGSVSSRGRTPWLRTCVCGTFSCVSIPPLKVSPRRVTVPCTSLPVCYGIIWIGRCAFGTSPGNAVYPPVISTGCFRRNTGTPPRSTFNKPGSRWRHVFCGIVPFRCGVWRRGSGYQICTHLINFSASGPDLLPVHTGKVSPSLRSVRDSDPVWGSCFDRATSTQVIRATREVKGILA